MAIRLLKSVKYSWSYGPNEVCDTTIISSTMRSWKILFIIVWKVAGLLVIQKNITKGSNSP